MLINEDSIGLIFSNDFVNSLPGDPQRENFRREVLSACYSVTTPFTAQNPSLLSFSPDLAYELGLNNFVETHEFLSLFTGKQVPPEITTYASCYGGHQFGVWAGQLGDGRCINFGEVKNRDGIPITLQTKGSGPTPYSRMGDGFAVLRSSIREYLASEAMHHLGIPTTRALALIRTGDKVIRDMFYDGHPEPEQGAITVRSSPSFIRFGNFELYSVRNEIPTLKKLLDYTIARYYPELISGRIEESYSPFFREVCIRTANLIAAWNGVGFVHGVMNTDNMSVLGLTIDYGPFCFMDIYDENWTPNTTDTQGRYSVRNQSVVAKWNLYKLACALLPVGVAAEELEDGLALFDVAYEAAWLKTMRNKLGLVNPEKGDRELILQLLQLLHSHRVDWTIFFRQLSKIDPLSEKSNGEDHEFLVAAFYETLATSNASAPFLSEWLKAYRHRLSLDRLDAFSRNTLMKSVNPKYVLRNYLAQEAIEAAENADLSKLKALEEVLSNPYSEHSQLEHLSKGRPSWAKTHPHCSALSCSS